MAQAALDLLLHRLSEPLELVDVGARWGANARWAVLGGRANILCFEPDAEECARLDATRPANVHFVPIGLAETDGPQTLHVTVEPACSSVHPPVPELVAHYPPLGIIAEIDSYTIPCSTLDNVLPTRGIARMAGIKLDTQGSELAILKGAVRSLESCALVDIEVEFNPLYSGQGLFCDVDRFLRDQGFVLWRLENLVHYAPEAMRAASSSFLLSADPSPYAYTEVPNGQLFWAQAQYVRATYPRTGAETMSMAEAAPAAVLAGVYGYWDLALELVRKTGDAELLASLRSALDAPG